MFSKDDVINFLNFKVFDPGIKFSKENNVPEIAQGIRYTKMRMSQLNTSEQVIHYFWSAVIGTDKSIKFAKLMKKYNIIRFEDVFEEFREKFKI